MDTEYELLPPQRWPLVVAVIGGILWLFLTVIAFAPLAFGALPAGMQAVSMAAVAVLGLIAPVAVLFLVAVQLRERTGSRANRTALMAEHARFTDQKLTQGAEALDRLEHRMATLAARIDAVANPVESHNRALLATISQLEAASARLIDASGRTEAATATLGSATPAATAQAERLTRLLEVAETDLQRQLAETETILAALNAQAAAAEAQARATTDASVAGVNAITASATAAQAAVAAPLAQLVEGVDNAFTRTAAAMDATRDGVHAQTNAMLASVDQARVTLDHIGGESARQIKARLDMLFATTAQIGAELDAQASRSTGLFDDVARGFAILDAKLDNSIGTGNAAMEGLAARMTEARETIHRLGDPIAVTEAALAAVESRLALVGNAAGETLGSLRTALPAALPQLESMSERLSELHDRADQLTLPLTAGGVSIATAQAQLDRAREALDTAAVQLGNELSLARDALADIETLTGSASLAASSQLIEVFGRVREIANQTAGTMRETLSNVVAEAEAALDQAGGARAEAAFGVPIRAQLAEVEVLQSRVAAAGQAAAERITQRLLALTETVATVENRIDEADTRFEIRSRNTLAKRASSIVDSLQGAAIDIAGLLSFQIEDTAWDAYLKGDRSIFARRIVEQLDAGTTRAIARHFQHDQAFRTEATHYLEAFETLIGHVLPDREGRSLAVTLLSSNIGRVYIAIGQAIDRFS